MALSSKERSARYRERNRERIRQRSREKYAADPERHREYQRKYRRAHPEWRVRAAKTQRERSLKHRYGISLAEYEAMLEAQGGVCAICKQSCSRGDRLAVDHDHETGRVRALLCALCNLLIAHAREDKAVLEAAIGYLEEHGRTY